MSPVTATSTGVSSMKYRQEWKYFCTQAQLDALRYRLLPVMKYDIHQTHGDSYHIRSLYFDDFKDSGMQENEDGLDMRKKFRIRIYDRSADLVHLEIKYKHKGLTSKKSCPISYELCQSILRGESIPYREDYPEPLREFYLETHTKGLHPVTIVEYERTAFVYPVGNVRITFDRNIAYSNHISRFFEENTYAVPALETGQHILEVKFDGFLPSQIRNAVDTGHLNRTAFSKYYISRSNYHRGILL